MIGEEIGKDKVDKAMLKIHAKKINFNLRIAEIVRQFKICGHDITHAKKRVLASGIIHVNFGVYNTRYAPVFVCQRKSRISTDILFLNLS